MGVVYEDSGDKLYITGSTGSSDFPTTSGAYQTSLGMNGSSSTRDGFIAKLDYDGPTSITPDYSTFVGASGTDRLNGICIDSSGNAFVTGYSSGSYPTTSGVYRTSSQHGAVVTKLNSSGSALSYSTFIDSSTELHSEGFDIQQAEGRAVVTGVTIGDTPAINAFQSTGGGEDAFFARMNTTGNLIVSTYLGSTGQFSNEAGYGIQIGSVSGTFGIIAGYSNQSDFPTTTNAYDQSHNGVSDAFLSKVTS